MAYSGVATGIFAIRNCDKTENGDIGRLPVTVGQTATALKAFSQTNLLGAKITQSIFDSCEQIAKTDKLVNGLSKVVKFASDNVNPLIVVSSGVKVAMADDDERTKVLISEIGGLAGMFAGEGWIKKNLDGYLQKLSIPKKWQPIVKGLLFVAGSIGSSTLGQGIGEKVADCFSPPKKAELNSPKISDEQSLIKIRA